MVLTNERACRRQRRLHREGFHRQKKEMTVVTSSDLESIKADSARVALRIAIISIPFKTDYTRVARNRQAPFPPAQNP